LYRAQPVGSSTLRFPKGPVRPGRNPREEGDELSNGAVKDYVSFSKKHMDGVEPAYSQKRKEPKP